MTGQKQKQTKENFNEGSSGNRRKRRLFSQARHERLITNGFLEGLGLSLLWKVY